MKLKIRPPASNSQVVNAKEKFLKELSTTPVNTKLVRNIALLLYMESTFIGLARISNQPQQSLKIQSKALASSIL